MSIYTTPPGIVNKVIDGVITMPTGGKWIRCDELKDTGQIDNGRPIWWKCHRKKNHDGQHKDNRGRNKTW